MMREQNRLILLGWYNVKVVENILVPDIEQNCKHYGILFPDAYKVFQENYMMADSLIFHHSYAEKEIPMGQEYNHIALMEHYEIIPDSIQVCHSRIICFLTAYRTQPSQCAMKGHHESSLIQFKQGIPPIIYDELYEIKELPFDPTKKQICLF